jgi:hypothetical protein
MPSSGSGVGRTDLSGVAMRHMCHETDRPGNPQL